MAVPCKELNSADGDRLLALHGQHLRCLICGSTDDLQAHALDHTPADRATKWHIVPLCGPHHAKLHSRFTGQPRGPLPKCVAHFAACANKVFGISVPDLAEKLRHWMPNRESTWLKRATNDLLGHGKKKRGRRKSSATGILADILALSRGRSKAKSSRHTRRGASGSINGPRVTQ